MKARNQKDETLDREILEAAKILFSQYGLKKTTMEDVSKAIGKGKSTLYYYYPGKTELFEAVVNDELRKMLQDIRVAINNESTSAEKLRAFLSTRLKMQEKVENLSEVVHNDIFDNLASICRIRSRFESLQADFIREIVVGGIQSGEFRDMPVEEIAFFSNLTAATFSGLELPLSTSKNLLSTDDSCKKIINFILFGIGLNARRRHH